MTITSIEDVILQTDASGAPVRLEYVRGHMKWEASPASRHQKAAKAIEASLRSIPGHGDGCACFSLQDTLIRFPDPDQSLKRPDIAIFCEEPPDSDEARMARQGLDGLKSGHAGSGGGGSGRRGSGGGP